MPNVAPDSQLVRTYCTAQGFPGGPVVKKGSIPGWGRVPGEGNGNPLQCPFLGNPMDRGAWWAAVQGATRIGHNLVTKQQLHSTGKREKAPKKSISVAPLSICAHAGLICNLDSLSFILFMSCGFCFLRITILTDFQVSIASSQLKSYCDLCSLPFPSSPPSFSPSLHPTPPLFLPSFLPSFLLY